MGAPRAAPPSPTLLLLLLLGPAVRAAPRDGALGACPLPCPAVPRLLRSAVRSLGPAQRDADEMSRDQALLFLFAMHDHDRSGQLDGLELLQLLGAVLTQGGEGRPSPEAVRAGVRAPRGPCVELRSHRVPIRSRPRRWPRWWTELWSSGTAAGTDCWTPPSCCCPPRHGNPREETALPSRGRWRGTSGSRKGCPLWGRRRRGWTRGRAAPQRGRVCGGTAVSRETPRPGPPWKRTRRRNWRRPLRTESSGLSPPRRRHPPPWKNPGRCRRCKGLQRFPAPRLWGLRDPHVPPPPQRDRWDGGGFGTLELAL
uniref:Cell growth regulator with EF-hand domain 1 n=1 Tax=Coturnix japonica TaxID=93934 RepID=A0A8C2TIC2_COTJA